MPVIDVVSAPLLQLGKRGADCGVLVLSQAYGPVAWFWESEELIRKLLLTGVAVLMDTKNPVQITLAVMISGWAHVVHSVYKVGFAG